MASHSTNDGKKVILCVVISDAKMMTWYIPMLNTLMENEKDKPVYQEPSTYFHAPSPFVPGHVHSSVQPLLIRYHLYMYYLNRISCYPQKVSSLRNNEFTIKARPVSKFTSMTDIQDTIAQHSKVNKNHLFQLVLNPWLYNLPHHEQYLFGNAENEEWCESKINSKQN